MMREAWQPPIMTIIGAKVSNDREIVQPWSCLASFSVLRELETHPLVVVALDPGYQAKKSENLGLYTKRNVELFHDIVYTEWNSRPSPQHHHR